jgi:hypothetical protein
MWMYWVVDFFEGWLLIPYSMFSKIEGFSAFVPYIFHWSYLELIKLLFCVFF